ncbi:MAG: succinyl-diaminopimelate desuccinylase [Actinomycetales bacterium]
MTPVAVLDLAADPVDLTVALCDIPSVSGEEGPLTDAVEAALRGLPHLEVLRDGNVLVARTSLSRAERVVLAGHLDTVPVADNLPVRRDRSGDGSSEILHGCGVCDMKGGVATMLAAAAAVPQPVRDVTYVFYDCEEVESARNGLGRLARTRPELLEADFAVLLEPSNAAVEAGCQGTLRVEVTTTGQRAHTARSWMGSNAIHAAGEVLDRLRGYQPRQVEIDGLTYREGLNAVAIRGGVAGNVVPDACVVTVNYRFAPSRSEAEALDHVREVFDGYEVVVTDSAPGALPGLDRPAAAEFVAAVGGQVAPKFGWTDVARFSAIGVPAVNFGPGDPTFAHRADEHVDAAQIRRSAELLCAWLRGQ